MRLTPLKIQIAIIKAFYSLALKSIKYYGGLVAGVNNSCLLKEARLLRAYIDILRNFKIVGSTSTCHCCVEGNYTVELVNGLEITNSPIQFECNNQGYLVYNGTGYPFTYYYDSNNSLIQIDFTTMEESITFEDVEFTSECNITNGQTTQSPIEIAEIEVTGLPITTENEYGDWSGSLELLDDNDDVVYSLTIPAGLLSNPEAIVDLWNNDNAESGWFLSYTGGIYVMTTPIEPNALYSSYSVVFSQYEGPTTDSFGTRTITFEFQPDYIPAENTQLIPTTQFSGAPGNILVTDDTLGVVYFKNSASFVTVQDYIDDFNEFNTAGMSCQFAFISGSDTAITYSAPVGTGSEYNGTSLTYDFYGTGYTYTSNWQLGVDPSTGRLTINLLNIFNAVVATLYVDSVDKYYSNYQEIVDALNNSLNNLGFSNSSLGDRFQYFSPEDSYAFYNTFKINVLFNYTFPDYTDINEQALLANGVDPTLVTYSDLFSNTATIGDFINDNPCTPETIEQTCLSNKDVSKIIAHIDKLVR